MLFVMIIIILMYMIDFEFLLVFVLCFWDMNMIQVFCFNNFLEGDFLKYLGENFGEVSFKVNNSFNIKFYSSLVFSRVDFYLLDFQRFIFSKVEKVVVEDGVIVYKLLLGVTSEKQ